MKSVYALCDIRNIIVEPSYHYDEQIIFVYDNEEYSIDQMKKYMIDEYSSLNEEIVDALIESLSQEYNNQHGVNVIDQIKNLDIFKNLTIKKQNDIMDELGRLYAGGFYVYLMVQVETIRYLYDTKEKAEAAANNTSYIVKEMSVD